MKPAIPSRTAEPDTFPVTVCHISLGVLAIILFAGCATEKPLAIVQAGTPNSSTPIQLELGVIGLTSPGQPPQIRFDKAVGQIDSAAEGAGAAARQMLEDRTFGDPALEMGAGAVRFVLAPLAAAAGTLGVAQKKLTPDKLTECESDLTRAMTLAADQRFLRRFLVAAANEKIPGRLVAIDDNQAASLQAAALTALLEVSTEELHLERTGPGDGSFALQIKVRVRLLRPEDRIPLLEQSFSFRSGKALFIDWTRGNGLPSVAETGYRELAGEIVSQFFSASSQTPLLAGAGFKKGARPAADSRDQVVAHRSDATSRPSIQFVNHDPESPAAARFVSVGSEGPGMLGIYSTPAATQVAIQKPLTKEEAVSEAIKDVEWMLDGLDNSQNPVVMLAATAAAIPISVWQQSVGAVRGVTNKRYHAADQYLTAAIRETHLHEQLAFQVAEQLTPKTSQAVMLVKGPLRPNAEPRSEEIASADQQVLIASPGKPTAANPQIRPGPGTALEIQILSAALTGNEGNNPALALAVEAQANLLRVRDGQQIYSIPVHYRSKARKFTDWAAHDARLFRQELEACYHQLSGAIADDLVSHELLPPPRQPYSNLAAASNR